MTPKQAEIQELLQRLLDWGLPVQSWSEHSESSTLRVVLALPLLTKTPPSSPPSGS